MVAANRVSPRRAACSAARASGWVIRQPTGDRRPKEYAMLICIVCHFDTDLDDVTVSTTTGRCICLRCYGRETSSALTMPGALRRALIASLKETHVVER